jgi:predicted AlkP superfamily pyrophosphatase or phosphodiesterase
MMGEVTAPMNPEEPNMPVVFILIDGLRPDAIDPARSPNLAELRARGASSMRATSVMPSVTLPCHTSIFHSVPPTRHGITSNLWTPLARPLPGLVDLAHTHGKRCAFFYNWEELRDLNRPGSLAYAYFSATAYQEDGDDLVAAAAAQTIPGGGFDFAFVYFGTVDTAGHVHGWMSDGYLAQLARVDAALGTLLAALPSDTAVLLHSDHGGHERTHGTELPEDMTIPWIAAGPGIRQSHTIAAPVSLLDTAPTIARLLGFPPHPDWEGQCVEEIFAEGKASDGQA